MKSFLAAALGAGVGVGIHLRNARAAARDALYHVGESKEFLAYATEQCAKDGTTVRGLSDAVKELEEAERAAEKALKSIRRLRAPKSDGGAS